VVCKAVQKGSVMFDAYHKWLGIPKAKHPATYYQLLGIQPGERDAEVIEEAAIRQSTHLRNYQLGAHAALCTQLLNEIAQAKAVLLNPEKRSAYDSQLANAAAGPPATAVAISDPRARDSEGHPSLAHGVTTKKSRSAPRRPAAHEDESDDDPDLSIRKRRHRRRHSESNMGLILTVCSGVIFILFLPIAIVGALYYVLRSGGVRNAPAGAAVVEVRQGAVPIANPGAPFPVRDAAGKANAGAAAPLPALADDPPAPNNPNPAGALLAANVRFRDRGDYVEDLQTGLWWQKDGDASGKMNYYQAFKYAASLKLGGQSGWRVPNKGELAAIFPANEPPFVDTKYNKEPFGKGQGEWDAYWTSELDMSLPDYAFVYQWYGKGGANNCYASKNFVYVRCVRDPPKK
jgi:hypothetical protein